MMLKLGDMNHFIFLALKNEKTNITFRKRDTFKVNLLKNCNGHKRSGTALKGNECHSSSILHISITFDYFFSEHELAVRKKDFLK